MELREVLEPNITIASKLYPIVKNKIADFTEYWDKNPDKAIKRHKELEQELQDLTRKDISKFDLWEYWEADGLENLAFRIALPEPIKISDFKKEELTEVVTRIKTFEDPSAYQDNEVLMLLWANKSDYYYKLLKHNFSNYDYKFFSRQKDKQGNYFEYSVEEIVDFIWEN